MAHRPVLVSYLFVYMKFVGTHPFTYILPVTSAAMPKVCAAATDCMTCKAEIVPLWFFAETLLTTLLNHFIDERTQSQINDLPKFAV